MNVDSLHRYNDSRFNGAKPAKPFWRNVVLIALAHVALIGGLIRWSQAARVSPNSESIVWLGAAADLASAQSKNQGSPEHVAPPPPSESTSKDDELERQQRVASTVKSEIELPSSTPNPTPKPTPAPKRTATPAPKPKVTPIAARNATRSVAGGPTPKKPAVTKPSAKPPAKAGSSPAKLTEKSQKKEKIPLAKKEPASEKPGSQTGSTAKSGGAADATSASEFGWYGNMLHDRFYRAWIQPTTNVTAGTKISTLVKVRIEKDGHVSKFDIIKPSANVVVNESVRVVAKQVTQVDPPPTALIKGDHYDVKINFELNTGEQ